jgi:hypothetical protein
LNAGDVVVAHVGSADSVEHGALRCAGRRDGHCHHRGGLALAKVAAHRFPRNCRVTEGTHHVIAHLEGVAEWQTVRRQWVENLVEPFRCGERSAEVEWPFDGVLAALVAADPFGHVAASLVADAAEDVEELAHVQLDTQLVPDLPGRCVGAVEQLIGVDEGQVADQDRRALAKAPAFAGPASVLVAVCVDGVRCGCAATGGRIVHHVVVEQCEGMHELERCAGLDDHVVIGVAADADVSPVAERRS